MAGVGQVSDTTGFVIRSLPTSVMPHLPVSQSTTRTLGLDGRRRHSTDTTAHSRIFVDSRFSSTDPHSIETER